MVSIKYNGSNTGGLQNWYSGNSPYAWFNDNAWWTADTGYEKNYDYYVGDHTGENSSAAGGYLNPHAWYD